MDINFSQVGQNIAELTTNKFVQPSVEQNVKDTERENQSVQAKVVELSAENKEQASSVQRDLTIEDAVTQISDFVQANNRQLNFSIDEGSEKQVVKVTDADSGEVIRQIPSEEVLRLSERLKNLQSEVGAAVGVFFNKQV
jgi:flagellar protein FlaG